LIDLHTHTTASDGRCTPDDLVARAATAGVDVLSVTDHDTTAACETVRAACGRVGIEFVPGIEVTAVADGGDVHVLGYFIDPASANLMTFLFEQRARRIDRIRLMIERLRTFGIDLDLEAIIRPGLEDRTRSVGRPWIARALVAGGHVPTTKEAFDLWLAKGRPAFVPRVGAAPEEVVRRIHDAGGIASLAHPGLLGRDDLIPDLAVAGLDALEAYHSEHLPSDVSRYAEMADRLALAVSGGSDFHGDDTHGVVQPGSTALPPDRYEKLKRRKSNLGR
jgi:predicted metal-dependent phosphoesterase TrpH